MESSKILSLSFCLFLICIIYFPQHSLSCGSCDHRKGGKPSTKPPVTVPTVPIPPVTVPTLPVPPVTVPKLPIPPVYGVPIPPVSGVPIPPIPELPIPPIPELPLPPVSGVPFPPVSGLPLPPVPIVGPIVGPHLPPATGGKGCPPPPGSKKATCPINTLKLGACVDLLGGLVNIKLGDPSVNKCCPLLKGLAEVEAAACLCTTLKLRALNLKLYVPVALQLLLTCGKNPPPGYTCSI